MQKDKRKTDFWITNKSKISKAAPGKYNVPILSTRKDHYYGPASFGSTQGRFDPKVVKQKKILPGPGDYESEPLSLVSHNIKNSYQSVFNSKVEDSQRVMSHSRSNSLSNKNVSRTVHTSQMSSIQRDGFNFNRSSIKNSGNYVNTTNDKIIGTNQQDLSTLDSNELGSLILNSPIERVQKQAMKLRKGFTNKSKTSPSIPYKKPKKGDVLSPVKYNPNHELLHKNTPCAIIKGHDISSPHNNSSLNKYIEAFIGDVVDSSSKGENQKKLLERINKFNSDESSANHSVTNNSLIQSMSNHLNTIVGKTQKQEGGDSFYIEANDYHSIALHTAPIESNIKMRSPFVSKTERYPDIKQSPGPGDYNLIQENSLNMTDDMMTSPQAFGSTYKNRTHFLNVEKTPFGNPSFMNTPGVGHYYKAKKIPKRIQNEIIKAQRERAVEDGVMNKTAFLGSSQRPCLSDRKTDSVGPGKYGIAKHTSKSEVRNYPFKNPRKQQKSVFISTSPRFRDVAKPPENALSNPASIREGIKQVHNKNNTSDDSQTSRWKRIKKQNFENNLKREKSKQSFMFQSGTNRFFTPKPQTIENLSKKEMKKVSQYAALFGPHQKNLYQPGQDLDQKEDQPKGYTQAINKIVGFSSEAPRFKSPSEKNNLMPGPGSYQSGKFRTEEDVFKALQEADGKAPKKPRNSPTAAFKSESRLKHSMINLIKESPGPADYNSSISTIRKKTFNYDLAKNN
ncbi:unnamed protein product [Moneuplotes crassus]|uniref:Uncharacterized protein n=2 Tax=Euplotes crassus TaxID=5936 RepID=A0AAD1TZC9_EUPCR|nr:unnamed protein product [Moneuplotes crassus]